MVRAAQKADGLGSASTDRTQYDELMIGLDVGSTTVKAVVMDPRNDEILWKDYERHETRQPEKVLDFLNRIEADFPLPTDRFRIFITGSGGKILEDYIGAKLVQEVNAVSLAAEHLYPEAGSVIELGGQDAKIIIWLTDEETGTKRKVPSMNDKCAGGTGAVIDKIAYKLQLEGENLRSLPYFDVKLHPVAGKCGVFAETDINGLQKQGIPPDQLMASLYEAIVQQNLSVLTRGNTLRPTVLLLGGPNTFIPALRDCWKENIPKIWKERNVPLPESVDPADLVMTPDNAQYYAAIGAVLYGKGEDPDVGAYKGTDALTGFIEVGRTKMREASGDVGLWRTEEELEEFKQLFAKEPWEPATFSPGQEVEAFVGIDGGSTSTKGVLMDREGNVLAAAYQLSKGNPLSDTQDILADLRESVESQGAVLNVAGVGTTGYAKDMLKDTLAADVAIVETVAHTKSALHYYPDADVIVDVGGQDIKVIVLNNGKVKDFKLNTQCSAGNGYFLQNTASKFGYSVAEFADVAFSAEKIPVFGYGCAVFMETDIVNFQQLGWEKKEIMAGLAKVLPKNIWLYVVAEPNLRKFGTKFILQGGTQHNLAAVKSQYDFIKSKVPESTIRVHKFTGESGAIGAALEATRVAAERDSSFIGIAAAQTLEFTSTRDESTRCSFCKNTCLRTFVDTKTSDGETNRFIIATCEKGQVEKVEDVKAIKSRMDEVSKANPNFVEKAALAAFRSTAPPKVSTLQEETGQEPAAKTKGLLSIMRWRKAPAATRAAPEVVEQRASIKIGMPRALNMYSLAPFFSAYFHALGVGSRNVIYSDYTNPEMWFKGSRRGSIDQCFPSKVAIAHVHNLIFDQKVKPDVIFFPIIQNMRTELVNTVDNTACPVVSITPEVIKAAYTQEGNIFAQNGIQYIAPAYDMANWPLFEHQIFESFRDILSLTSEENSEAVEIALASWRKFYEVTLRAEARQVLDSLEEHGKVGVVMLGRPYHNDPGLNHEIMIDMQRRGYPIFSIDSLPQDEDILDRLFGEDIRSGLITHAMDITDVWKNNYSENSSKKIWAAKYVARHPNLVAIDLSSFKCGHDAPIYNTVERIIEASETPYFTFHDVDENKPTGSIKIRVETVDYFLKRYQEYLQSRRNDEVELEQLVEQYRAHLEAQSERNASRAEVRAAGNVSFTGNGADNHVGHDHNGNNGHDEAEWVSLPAPSGLNGHNGNGNSPEHSLENGAAIAPNGNGQSRDHAAYDRIRALNTSGDAPEDDPASASLSCNLPTRDFAPKAYQHLDHEENGAEDAPPGIPDHQWMTMQIMTPRAKKGDKKSAAVPSRPTGGEFMAKVMDKQDIETKTREYAERLRDQMGLQSKVMTPFEKPFERPWTKAEIETTTVLFGGLTLAHEELTANAMRGMGYKIQALPVPDLEALQIGKEYGNRGQCNPTYFTVGSLVQYLKKLEAQGETDIEDRYVFVTAGSCGPCRFGMYEAEYRQALRDSGFGRFRVLIFQQAPETEQSTEDTALEFSAKFGLTLLRAFILGDMLNELGYKIRPYEVNKGDTDRAMAEAKELLGAALREGQSVFRGLRKVKKIFNAIQVDVTRVKPKVKITGEFWAQTTEGDGNYHMFQWLESEGAEVLVEPIGTWIEYKIWIARHHAEKEFATNKDKKSSIRKLRFAQIAFRMWHNFYRTALGFKTDPLPNQAKLAEYASAYYNTHLGGGEGHLEIGKNVMATKDRHAHMVISLKPFGCMPSTMSDGVQARVVADYKDAIFIPIETSGDGEVSARSRVQMKLYEAKKKAREEMDELLAARGVTIEQVQSYVDGHPKYANAMRKLPEHQGISSAANLVAEVAGRIK